MKSLWRQSPNGYWVKGRDPNSVKHNHHNPFRAVMGHHIGHHIGIGYRMLFFILKSEILGATEYNTDLQHVGYMFYWIFEHGTLFEVPHIIIKLSKALSWVLYIMTLFNYCYRFDSLKEPYLGFGVGQVYLLLVLIYWTGEHLEYRMKSLPIYSLGNYYRFIKYFEEDVS